MEYNPKTGLLEGEVEIPERGISEKIITKIIWGDSELNPEKENG